MYWNSGRKFKINKNQNLLTNEESRVKVNERKWELIILAYKTLYGFQKLGGHSKFVAVHLDILRVLCSDLLHPGSVCLGFHVSLVILTKWIHLTISTPFLLIITDLKIDCITFMTVKPMKRIVFIPNAWPISSIILDASRCASFRSMFFSLISYELKSLNI